jgi:ATP-dependent Clp protease adaptor protein ClpS
MPMSQSPSDRSADHPEPPRSRRLPPYQLVLHRSNEDDRMRTLRTIMELTRFGVQEATQKIGEAENLGRCSLLVTHKERAELFAEIFTERKLNVSVEPVAGEC